MTDVIIVGGGPAGMMAAYAAGMRGLRTMLLEKNEKLGKKLFITGKGRCNITNACDTQEYFRSIVKNPKFPTSALYKFPNGALLELLHEYGLQTKTERGGRVFPLSDKSSDVIKALEKMLRAADVDVRLNQNVKSIRKNGRTFAMETDSGIIEAKSCVLAAGGVSYPSTGSTGDGYTFARAFGHSIVQPTPALVPLEAQVVCARMQGLSLRNVRFTLFQDGKRIYQEQGELLFTHFGISGPVVISASCYIDYAKMDTDLHCLIDTKPALSPEKLDARLVREFEANSKKQLKNCMEELLPSKMIHPFLDETGLDANKPVNQITRAERIALLESLKGFYIKVFGARPIEEAIVTAGGVDVSEINPSTMESKLMENLYMAGELCDCSALTGGFNLQIAFSTGYLAGNSIIDNILK